MLLPVEPVSITLRVQPGSGQLIVTVALGEEVAMTAELKVPKPVEVASAEQEIVVTAVWISAT